VTLMREALASQLPHARVLVVLDERLLSEVERRGRLQPECVEPLATQIGLAIDVGAAGVLLTCTASSGRAGHAGTLCARSGAGGRPRDAEAGELGVPVLTSPELAVEQLRERVREVRAAWSRRWSASGSTPPTVARVLQALAGRRARWAPRRRSVVH
jgi:hypothetical protein